MPNALTTDHFPRWALSGIPQDTRPHKIILSTYKKAPPPNEKGGARFGVGGMRGVGSKGVGGRGLVDRAGKGISENRL